METTIIPQILVYLGFVLLSKNCFHYRTSKEPENRDQQSSMILKKNSKSRKIGDKLPRKTKKVIRGKNNQFWLSNILFNGV